MLANQQLPWKPVLNRSFLLGILFFVLLSPLANAAPPPDPLEQSVPVQLTMIQDYLVDMEGRLSQQMTDMEGRLGTSIADVQNSVDVGNGKLDNLQTTANNIYDVVTAVNIELTSTLCFDAGAKFEGGVGIHDEVGVGWPNVVSAKAIFQGEGAIGGEVNVNSQLCVEVPLYAVESYDQLFTNTGEFDDLIAALALPNQSAVPLLANVYTVLMPTPDQAFEAVANVTKASTGYDINDGTFGTPTPELLLRPDMLLGPVIPHAAVNFIAEVPAALQAALLDPCGTLESTPIGAALEDRDDLEFLCSAQANIMKELTDLVTLLWEPINQIVEWLAPDDWWCIGGWCNWF